MRIKAIIYLIFTLLASVIVVETCFFSERFRDNKFKCEVVAGSLDI